jgi:hypothetical protein
MAEGYVPGGVAVGRIVHFVPPDGQGYKKGQYGPAGYDGEARRHLGAIINHVWSPTMNLTVFPDGTNDFDAGPGIASALVRWETSVDWDPDGEKPRSWHFPETV